MPSKPVVLIIRDGWGINPEGREKARGNGDATLLARTPFHDELYATYPMSRVSASGEDVGLPAGQMGNSEVGHLNLGAGRVVYQDLTRINKAIREGQLWRNSTLQAAFEQARGRRLHFIGLISDGGVHSHQDHLVALVNAAYAAGCRDLMVHAITDGRDTSPTGGAGYLRAVQAAIEPAGAVMATVIGRYFAMDRDNRWERTKTAWDAIVFGRGQARLDSPSQAVEAAYATEPRGDEFLLPMVFSAPGEQRVRDGDVVLWFNFRADRARQLSQPFLDPEFKRFPREVAPKVGYYTLTEYDSTYYPLGCRVIYRPESLKNILGEFIAGAGLKQLRAAETEKYPHVTFFFNGGIETPFAGEDRYLSASPKDVPTYDNKPQMSAPELTFEVWRRLEEYDLVILNYANPDMVGHTGVVKAGIHACETTDLAVRIIVEKVLALGGKCLVTADHGNCEQMRNPDGSPNTAHSTNLVHCLYVANDAADYQMRDGILADIAPTLLDMLGLPKPVEMTGRSLLVRLTNATDRTVGGARH
ncbi:MAG: 2,3-bisphosphoglycerate-independent phosphoglycerate mutase [Verrucomicrobiales bacterium]